MRTLTSPSTSRPGRCMPADLPVSRIDLLDQGDDKSVTTPTPPRLHLLKPAADRADRLDHGSGGRAQVRCLDHHLVLEFPKTADEEMDGLLGRGDRRERLDFVLVFQGAGRQRRPLLVASRRETPVMIRDVLRNMSMLVDFVSSVDEAGEAPARRPAACDHRYSIQRGGCFIPSPEEILDEVRDSASSRSSSRA